MTAQFDDERDADKSQSPEEAETLSRHFAYLSDLIDKGVTITETNCPLVQVQSGMQVAWTNKVARHM